MKVCTWDTEPREMPYLRRCVPFAQGDLGSSAFSLCRERPHEFESPRRKEASR